MGFVFRQHDDAVRVATRPSDSAATGSVPLHTRWRAPCNRKTHGGGVTCRRGGTQPTRQLPHPRRPPCSTVNAGTACVGGRDAKASLSTSTSLQSMDRSAGRCAKRNLRERPGQRRMLRCRRDGARLVMVRSSVQLQSSDTSAVNDERRSPHSPRQPHRFSSIRVGGSQPRSTQRPMRGGGSSHG